MNGGIPIQLIPPEALEGARGVVWLASDGRRTTTQVATNVRYALRMTPNRRNTLGQTAILPPNWQGTLTVARNESYLRAGTEVVLALDDGQQVIGYLTRVSGFRTIRAEMAVERWLEAWH